MYLLQLDLIRIFFKLTIKGVQPFMKIHVIDLQQRVKTFSFIIV